jgi:hypothetical protein
MALNGTALEASTVAAVYDRPFSRCFSARRRSQTAATAGFPFSVFRFRFSPLPFPSCLFEGRPEDSTPLWIQMHRIQAGGWVY